MRIKIKKLHDNARIPTYGSDKSAGADLYAYIEDGNLNMVTIPAHKTVKIGTGVAIQPPNGYCGLIFARSGLATKQGLRPANAVGLCDCDYTGEYIVALHNDSDEPQSIHHGDRIAQLVFSPYIQAQFLVVDELDATERGDGGFGHTGR